MGYTHYWTFNRPATEQKAAKLEAKYQQALHHCNKMVYNWAKQHGGLSGYSAHTLNKYGGLAFNGSRELGHEDFVLRENLHQNEAFNFCKTAAKPYDALVTACLLILKAKLGDAIELHSDGTVQDWIAGQELAKSLTGLKNIYIPVTIVSHRERRAF